MILSPSSVDKLKWMMPSVSAISCSVPPSDALQGKILHCSGVASVSGGVVTCTVRDGMSLTSRISYAEFRFDRLSAYSSTFQHPRNGSVSQTPQSWVFPHTLASPESLGPMVRPMMT
jgi:hypothetical protein